jgi:hypothetical protein
MRTLPERFAIPFGVSLRPMRSEALQRRPDALENSRLDSSRPSPTGYLNGLGNLPSHC